MAGKLIAIAGKGGTGKTTFAALLLRYLKEEYPGKAILAVDADANANLNEALGMEVEETIGTILEDMKKPGAVPTGMSKDMFIEYRMSHALVESKSIDLLVMGNPQGPGCYCFPNDLLRKYLERLRKNYDFVVVDNEAGMEHISRRIINNIDYMIITSDASARGIRSARRIHEITGSLKLEVGRMGLIITRVQQQNISALDGEIAGTGLELLGTIPYDPPVAAYDLQARPLFDLPEDSLAWQEVRKVAKMLGI